MANWLELLVSCYTKQRKRNKSVDIVKVLAGSGGQASAVLPPGTKDTSVTVGDGDVPVLADATGELLYGAVNVERVDGSGVAALAGTVGQASTQERSLHAKSHRFWLELLASCCAEQAT